VEQQADTINIRNTTIASRSHRDAMLAVTDPVRLLRHLERHINQQSAFPHNQAGNHTAEKGERCLSRDWNRCPSENTV